jgi:hypothetical protein|tara:strand:+ start:159 stop:527 length:369 start_codon:yes stop_codon:yes gene_type:complete
MLTGTINRMWLDLTGEKLKNKGHSTKQQCDEDQQEPDDNHGTNQGGHRHGKQPDALLFKPEDILKMVGQKIQDVKIREKNTEAKLHTTQIRLMDAETDIKLAEKCNAKMEMEIGRLKNLLRK